MPNLCFANKFMSNECDLVVENKKAKNNIELKIDDFQEIITGFIDIKRLKP